MTLRGGVRVGLAAVVLVLSCGVLLWLSLREGPPVTATTATEERGRDAPGVVAMVGGEPISADELDASLRLRLHDLDRARYDLRARHLEALIAERREALIAERRGDPLQAGTGPEVEILLRPPEPPRVDVSATGAPTRGAPDAPVTILEFVDFQSPYCARMQPVLAEILDRHGDRVQLAVRNLPLAFHRYARLAAEAAACAREQGAYWDYHDVLLQEQPRLARPHLVGYATRLGLDRERFRECVDTGRFARDVAIDLETARRIGVSVAPTFFVNGRYMKGPQSRADLERAIARELGEPEPEESSAAEVRSERALALVVTVASEDPDRALAAIRIEGETGARFFRTGDAILPGVELAAIERRRVRLRHGDRIEVLVMGAEAGMGAEAAGAGPADAPASVPVEALPEPDAVLTLRRSEVSKALADRAGLERQIGATTMSWSGRRMLKVGDVRAGGLLERLGLQEGDVMLLIDGELATDDRNRLWPALEEGGEVTVVLLRKGFPRTYRYVIE